jgi:putative N6-adenine-specific DNA methylase
MVMASRWDTASPLLDPFCGSGTIPIEAAMFARKIPPGSGRRFAFMNWPNFDSRAWEELLGNARKAVRPTHAKIIASDRDAGAIRAAQANAARAGVAETIDFSCRSVSAIAPPPGPGSVVTNPPYGVRLNKRKDLRNLYAQLGKVLRAKCPGWSVTMLCDSIRLIHSTGLGFDKGISILNSGLKVRLVKCRI